MRYFKLVVCPFGPSETPGDWVEKVRRQILDGKAHFGWSWIPMDPEHGTANLWELQKKLQRGEQLEGGERVVWNRCQFLIKRIEIGDRLIIQTERPLRQFLIVEVTGPYGFLGTERDFNHYLECRAITEEYVNIDLVPQYVRHALTRRGRYYQIYGEATIEYLDSMIELKSWRGEEAHPRTHAHEKEETNEEIIAKVIKIIHKRWPAEGFETFMKELIGKMPGVEVVDSKASHKGWDFLIGIQDPCSGEFLHDRVPVQCKNYTDEVINDRPIEDLKRCVTNSDSSIVYLFILGDVTDEFKEKLADAAERAGDNAGRDVQFRIMDQHEIARLYMKYMVS